MNRKRNLAAIGRKSLIILALLVLFASCSNRSGSAGAGSAASSAAESAAVSINEDGTVNNPEAVQVDPNMLVFWSLFTGGDGGFMDRIISAYNATGPAKQVHSIMLVWADYYTKFQTAIATGNGPDIGVSHASKLTELVEQGAVIPIDSYLNEIGANLSDYYSDNSINSVTFDGETYAIPLDTHAEILYFNLDYIERAGVELNENGQLDIDGVEDFIALLDQLKTAVGDGQSVISLTNNGDDPYRTWWATYFQMGGPALFSEDGTAVTMDRAIGVRAAEFVKSLYDEGYVARGIVDHQQYFQAGSAALYIGGTWATGALEQTQNLRFGAQPWPRLFENDSCWADSHTLVIPYNRSRTEEETLEAVKAIFWWSTEGGLIWCESGQIPSATSVLSSEEYLALPYRSSYMSALDTSVLPPKNPNFYAMKADIIECLDGYWSDTYDAATAIDRIYDCLEDNL